MSEGQNMWWRKVSHARNVCLSLRTRSYVTHICVHVNCQNWPTIGIPEAGMIRCVENNANRFHFRVSLQLPRGLWATFLEPLSQLSSAQLFSIRFPTYLGDWSTLQSRPHSLSIQRKKEQLEPEPILFRSTYLNTNSDSDSHESISPFHC